MHARKLFVLLLLVVLILAIGQTRLVNASGTLDQQQTDHSNDVAFYNGPTNPQLFAQVITAGLSGGLTEVDLAISRGAFVTCSSCGPVVVEIHESSPTGTLLASTSEPASGFPETSNPSFFAFNFAAPASVSAGNQYAIVVTTSSTNIPDVYIIGVSATSSFPYSNDNPPNWAYIYLGASWTHDNLPYDLAFKTYVTPASCIATAAGGATACPHTSSGALSSFTAVSVGSLSPAPPSGVTFPFGLFSITENGLSPGQSVTVTITLSAPLPGGTFAYWKLESGTWTQLLSASLDPTRTIISLPLTADSSGTIIDPGGPTVSPTQPPTHPLNVGGDLLPVNLVQVLGPWVAALLALTVVVLQTLVIRRKNSKA